MAISRVFEITKRALLTHQSAINTTAKNIANVNTEGYTRRRVDLSNLSTGLLGLAQFGDIRSRTGVGRIRQQFVENQLLSENHDLGKYETGEMILTQIETIFGEPSDSALANVLSEFWNSWNDLANDPENQSGRILVRDKGVVLANTFNRLYTELRDLQHQVGNEIQDKITQVNRISREIASINREVSRGSSDDLLDQRDGLIGELSRLLSADVRENDNGQITISVGGQILVSGGSVNELTVELTTATSGLMQAEVEIGGSGRPADLQSGELSSLVEVHNEKVPGFIAQLDILAREIAEEVNTVHSAGHNLNGTTGVDFFADGISGAADFQVSDEVANDPSLIATAASPNEPGDGSVAQAISDIQFDAFVEGNNVSDFYASLLTSVGNEVREATFLRKSQEMVISQLQNQKEAISGVSLDEEMTKLIQFEQAYSAAARLVTLVDGMMETVINMV